MKNACVALLCWLSFRFLLLSMFFPILAEAVLQDSVLKSSIGLPIRRIWAAILLLPLLMPFFGGGAAEDSSSSASAMMLGGSSGSGSGSASSGARRRDAQSQRQRDRRANLSAGQVQDLLQANAAQHRDVRSAAQEERSAYNAHIEAEPPHSSAMMLGGSSGSGSGSASSGARRRDAQSQRQHDHRATLSEGQVQDRRQADAAQHRDVYAQHRDVRAAAQEERSAYNAHIEAELPHLYKFTEAELEYAADNFEQSPVAALAFLAANTGIASSPEDLGPLLDGVPDPAPLIAAFKKRTEQPLRGCACCGMRSYNCKPVTTLDRIAAHQMSAIEMTEYDALPAVLRQVRSTCVIAGSRYMLHPELVHIAPGTDTCPRPLPLRYLFLSLILSHFHAGVLQTDARFHRSCALTALERATRFTRCL
jgi:hypothetical protein